jgi:hypothetical protein
VEKKMGRIEKRRERWKRGTVEERRNGKRKKSALEREEKGKKELRKWKGGKKIS